MTSTEPQRRDGPWSVAFISMAVLAGLSFMPGSPPSECPTTQSPSWDAYNRLACGSFKIGTQEERLKALNAALDENSVPAYAALVRDGCLDCDAILYGKDGKKDRLKALLTDEIRDDTCEIDFLRAKLYFDGKWVSADYEKAAQYAKRAFDAQWIQAADIAAGANLAQGRFEEAYDWYRRCSGTCQRTTIDQKWLLERLENEAVTDGAAIELGDKQAAPPC